MTEITISLPDDLAEQVKAAGLLQLAALEKLFREALRKHGMNGLYAALDEISTIRLPAIAEAKIRTEVDAPRIERRARRRK